MARKRTESRSVISSEGGAAPAVRRRTHVKAAPKAAPAAEPEAVKSETTAVDSAVHAGAESEVVASGPISERDEIAMLAHSYWEARGGQGGSAEEDWLRAEQEFHRRRQSSIS